MVSIHSDHGCTIPLHIDGADKLMISIVLMNYLIKQGDIWNLGPGALTNWRVSRLQSLSCPDVI